MKVTATTPVAPAAPSAGLQPAAQPTEAAGPSLPPAGKALPAQPELAQPPEPISIERALQQIQDYLSDSKRQLNFERDESSGRTVIRVIDPASGEVIRQFPPEEILKIAAIIDATGFRTLDEMV